MKSLNNIVDLLTEKCKNYLKTYEPMNLHTSIKIGGQAKLFVAPKSTKSMIETIKILKENNFQYYILGNGTNTLTSDDGFAGAVISTQYLKKFKVLENTLFAESGLGLFELGKICRQYGLSGIEFLYGIPGSIGGAIT